METLTIKVKNKKVLKLIQTLEELELIQIVNLKVKKSVTKLSTLLSGSISPEKGDAIHEELIQIRNEWERNIY